MIIKYFTDNDLYKFSVMYAIQRLYPWSYVKYEFINRGKNQFPVGFAEQMQQEVNQMAQLKMRRSLSRRSVISLILYLLIFWRDINMTLVRSQLPKMKRGSCLLLSKGIGTVQYCGKFL